LSVAVYSEAKHAPFIEFGTAPHFPPLAKIKAWCKRRIPEAAAFLIARAISDAARRKAVVVSGVQGRVVITWRVRDLVAAH
jgi:hypothetical protein